jgi:hypothetical protein
VVVCVESNVFLFIAEVELTWKASPRGTSSLYNNSNTISARSIRDMRPTPSTIDGQAACPTASPVLQRNPIRLRVVCNRAASHRQH